MVEKPRPDNLPTENLRVLFVEDDPDVAELLITYFEMLKYDIHHAADGQEGIALARNIHPNVILLDVMLPDMNGWDIARYLRTTTLTRYIPIIFLTQRSERHDKIRGLGLGADDYVTKPFDVEELRLRIDAVVRRATQDRLYEPRTGLPGGPLIQDELNRQSGGQSLQITVNGRSAFRDAYGFLAADEALKFAAQITLQTIREHGTPDDFVGITDEDTLIVITHTTTPDSFHQALTQTFSTEIRKLYTFMDAERGYVILNPDTSQEVQVPLMDLHIKPIAQART